MVKDRLKSLTAGVWLAAFMCTTYPRQTWHPLFIGSVIEAVGIAMISWAIWREDDPMVYGMMALAGVGTGIRFMPGKSSLPLLWNILTMSL